MNGNGNGQKDYGPSVQLARLFQKKSASGNVFFAGRMGSARLVLLRSKDVGDDGAPIWNLIVQQAEQKQHQAQAEREGPPPPKRDWQAPTNNQLDDAIPF